MPEPVYLTTKELADKWTVEGVDCYDNWFDTLRCWRDRQKLRYRDHWKYERRTGSRRRVRVYLETHVLKLCANADSGFALLVWLENRQAILSASASPSVTAP